MSRQNALCASLAIASLAIAGPAAASFPAGVWSLPDNITVGSADSDQPYVVISGFMMRDAADGEEQGKYGGYTVPTYGYLYYQCPADKKDVCLLEWKDIETSATQDGCVGWGAQDVANGTIHAYGTALPEPDVYPIGIGVVSGYTPCEHLEDESPVSPPEGAVPAPPSDDAPPVDDPPVDDPPVDDPPVDDPPVDDPPADDPPADDPPADDPPADGGEPSDDGGADDGGAPRPDADPDAADPAPRDPGSDDGNEDDAPESPADGDPNAGTSSGSSGCDASPDVPAAPLLALMMLTLLAVRRRAA